MAAELVEKGIRYCKSGWTGIKTRYIEINARGKTLKEIVEKYESIESSTKKEMV